MFVRALLVGCTSLLAAAPAGSQAPGVSSSSGPDAGRTRSIEERLRLVQQRKRALEKDLLRLRSQERSLLGEVERLEVEVTLRGEELRETEIVLERAHREMDETVRRLEQIEAQVARTRPILAARARALYKLGELSYLRMLLSVERPSDLFRGYRFVTALARRDDERLARFRADLAAQAATRTELEERTRAALALRASLQRSRLDLEGDRRRKAELLSRITDERETHAAYVRELADAEGRLEQILAGEEGAEATVPVAAFRSALPWPVAGRVRVPFGRRKHPRFDTYTVQNGIEIEAPLEAPVRAVHEGAVVFADRFLGYGLMVALDHGAKHHTVYAHLGELLVQKGQRVEAGAVLGTVGASGLEGAGLYFEIRFQGRPEDPADWLGKQDLAAQSAEAPRTARRAR